MSEYGERLPCGHESYQYNEWTGCCEECGEPCEHPWPLEQVAA